MSDVKIKTVDVAVGTKHFYNIEIQRRPIITEDADGRLSETGERIVAIGHFMISGSPLTIEKEIGDTMNVAQILNELVAEAAKRFKTS